MISKIRSSSKTILTTLLSAIELDTRSTTGKNLREIMLLTDKLSIYDIKTEDADHFPYFPRPEEDAWKTEVIQCLLEEREQGNLDESDLELLNYLCAN